MTNAQLRAAFEKVRAGMEKEFQARRDAFVTALAEKLKLDRSKVEDALDALPRPRFGPHG